MPFYSNEILAEIYAPNLGFGDSLAARFLVFKN
jgi:hypothetical protein